MTSYSEITEMYRRDDIIRPPQKVSVTDDGLTAGTGLTLYLSVKCSYYLLHISYQRKLRDQVFTCWLSDLCWVRILDQGRKPIRTQLNPKNTRGCGGLYLSEEDRVFL